MPELFNPQATFPFCPKQTDFLCFQALDGFAAVDLNLIEGFSAGGQDSNGNHSPETTTIHLVNDNAYYSRETVPVLVARFAATKALRYTHERAELESKTPQPLKITEFSGFEPPVPPSPEEQPPATMQTRSIWKKD